MKAISLWQPWASAIACGAKHIETRHWSMAYRGPLLIHAGLSANAKLWPDVHQCLDSRCLWKSVAESSGWTRDPSPHIASQLNNWLHRLPRGALIAVAELVEIWCTEYLHLGDWHEKDGWRFDVTAQELALGDFTPGRFGWVLANVRAFPTPIPYRGRQGLFNVPDNIIPEEFR